MKRQCHHFDISVIPPAQTREDQEMDRMVKTLNVDDVAAEVVEKSAEESEEVSYFLQHYSVISDK